MGKTKLRVRERKLGRELAAGLYWNGESLIEVDPRLKSQEYLNTIIHEAIHHLCPAKSERWVSRAAGVICQIVWGQGYRKIAK